MRCGCDGNDSRQRHNTVCTICARRACRTSCALDTLRPLRTGWTLRTYCTGVALRTLRALWSRWTLCAGWTCIPGVAFRACGALDTLNTLRAGCAICTVRTSGTGRTLNAHNGAEVPPDVSVFVIVHDQVAGFVAVECRGLRVVNAVVTASDNKEHPINVCGDDGGYLRFVKLAILIGDERGTGSAGSARGSGRTSCTSGALWSRITLRTLWTSRTISAGSTGYTLNTLCALWTSGTLRTSGAYERCLGYK